MVPLFGNVQNQSDWPKVVSTDLVRHINNLKNKTHVISGQMKGKTQLPIPAGAEKVSDDDLKMAEKYNKFILKNTISFNYCLYLFVLIIIKEEKPSIKL